MTKQHFEAAARQVRALLVTPTDIECVTIADGNLNPSHVRAAWVAEAYAELFAQYNPRFDRARFLKACGLGEGV